MLGRYNSRWLSKDLQRTEYPDNNHLWDNDLLSQYFRFGWTHYYKTRLRLSNWLIWSKKEDRYIKSLLSASNNNLQSLSFEPELRLIIGDRLLFTNTYQIRADYTRYQFPELKKDNFLPPDTNPAGLCSLIPIL